MYGGVTGAMALIVLAANGISTIVRLAAVHGDMLRRLAAETTTCSCYGYGGLQTVRARLGGRNVWHEVITVHLRNSPQ